jgi:hypothetical protein
MKHILAKLNANRSSADALPEKAGRRNHNSFVAMLLVVILGGAFACERDTKLRIEGNNPPIFVLSGNGMLGTIRVRGPEKQRDAEGEDDFLYWVIVNLEDQEQSVESLGPVTYGKVPKGYKQVYPENGEAPPLLEGERYNIRIATANANGVDKYFIIRNGKVEVSDY